MNLSSEDGTDISDPSSNDISRLLMSLNNSNNRFLILALDELTYIQAYGSTQSAWTLEYQEGTTTDHFTSSDPGITTSVVQKSFIAFLEGEEDWKFSIPWEEDFERSALNPDIKKTSISSLFTCQFPKPMLILFLVFLCVGLILIGIGLYLKSDTEYFLESSTSVQAEVIQLLKTNSKSVKPVYLFMDSDGNSYEHAYHVSSYPAPHEVGDKITLQVNFSDPDFPDYNSVRYIQTSNRISNFILKFGIIFVLFIGLVWHIASVGGVLAIENRGGLSTIFAKSESRAVTRIQLGVFYAFILLFGVTGYILVGGFTGFFIGIILSFYAFALLRVFLN